MTLEALKKRQNGRFDTFLSICFSGRTLALELDLAIGLSVIGLIATIVTGGADLGIVTFTDAEKPILILAILIPLRLTLGERSQLLEIAQPVLARRITTVPTMALNRIPAAVRDAGFAIGVTRALTFAVGFIANLLFTPFRPRAFPMPFRYEKFAEIFADWDSGWYFGIAHDGYSFSAEGQSNIAFFPLYPMLMRGIGSLFGGSDSAIWLAGIAISCAAFAAALVVIHRLTQDIFGDREVARRTVLYIAVFPFALFFTRVYAESVFLLATAIAVSGAYRGRWWQAGVAGALATLARPNGILIALPLALFAIQGRPSSRELMKRSIPLFLPPLALLGYSLFVARLSGDLLAWFSAQAHWGYSLGHPPWQQLLKMLRRFVKYGPYDYFFVSPLAAYRLFHGIAALLFIAMTAGVFKRLGIPMGAYVLASLLVPLTGNALEGIGRYSSVLFPVFMLAGSWKSARLHEGILVTSSISLAFLVSLFSTGRPVY